VAESGPGDDRTDPDAGSDPLSDPLAAPSRRQVQQAYRRSHRHPWLRRGSIVMASGLALLLVMGVVGYFKI